MTRPPKSEVESAKKWASSLGLGCINEPRWVREAREDDGRRARILLAELAAVEEDLRRIKEDLRHEAIERDLID